MCDLLGRRFVPKNGPFGLVRRVLSAIRVFLDGFCHTKKHKSGTCDPS